MLTKNEKLLLADALNGCNVLLDCDPSWLQTMISVPGSGTGIEQQIEDSIRLDHADQKWSVDGPALLAKIRALPPAQREQLLRAIAAAWQRNDANFERDLETLAL